MKELPVGQNFQDHPIVSLRLHLKPEARAKTAYDRHTNCCVRYSSRMAHAGVNDMMLVSLNLLGDSIMRSDNYQSDDDPYGLIGVWVNQCFSRGEIRIVSNDPETDPEIEENMLSDERDMVRMRDGVRRLFAIGRHPAVQSIVEKIVIDDSGRTMDDLTTSAEVDEWILATASDTQHAVGTCRMGKPTDPRTVVNSHCGVLGINGLRVIDASIMPDVPRANTHLTCVMIGEHMATRLKQERS